MRPIRPQHFQKSLSGIRFREVCEVLACFRQSVWLLTSAWQAGSSALAAKCSVKVVTFDTGLHHEAISEQNLCKADAALWAGSTHHSSYAWPSCSAPPRAPETRRARTWPHPATSLRDLWTCGLVDLIASRRRTPTTPRPK